MSEWKEYRLGDLLKIKYGKDHKKLGDGEIPIYGSGGIMRTGDAYLSDKPSVLIPRKGTLSNIFYVEVPFWTVDTMFWSEINDNMVLPKYLYYAIKDYKWDSMNVGSAVPSLTVPVIESVSVSIPSLEIQKRIAAQLSEIDDKIAINRRICENLEAQAQALFKHWFIDFAPFKNGKFVESELGMIPEGWRVGTLGEIAEIIKPSIKPQNDVEYSHYSIPAFDNKKMPSCDNGGTIKSNKFMIQDSVTLLSKLNPDHKRIWFVNKVKANAICSTEFIPFYAKERRHSAFIYCYLNSWQNYREIANGAKGTTNSHQRIDANAILLRKIAYDKETINKFCDLVGELLEQENIAIQESSRLSALRDTLLPKLMSGEIKV